MDMTWLICTRGPVAACHVAGAGPPVWVIFGGGSCRSRGKPVAVGELRRSGCGGGSRRRRGGAGTGVERSRRGGDVGSGDRQLAGESDAGRSVAAWVSVCSREAGEASGGLASSGGGTALSAGGRYRRGVRSSRGVAEFDVAAVVMVTDIYIFHFRRICNLNFDTV
ncbi:hypothetical protein SUGI_1037090 [Cryptomeria japonica]|nr:hypothetical protein SUGI_1037090 [Cryptomeria japonica]